MPTPTTIQPPPSTTPSSDPLEAINRRQDLLHPIAPNSPLFCPCDGHLLATTMTSSPAKPTLYCASCRRHWSLTLHPFNLSLGT